MSVEERKRLIRYVDFLESEIEDYVKFQGLAWKEYQENKEKRRNVERWIENIVNSSIDIAKLILILERKALPDSYRNILYNLGATKYFDEDFGRKISKWAKLRNIIAHEYLDIRWKRIEDFIKNSQSQFTQLTEVIKKILLS